MAHSPVNLRVGDIKDTLEGAALKGESERVSDQTFRAVAADQVFRLDKSGRAAGRPDLRRDAAGVLRKTFEFGVPEYLFLMALQILVKELLVFALLQHEHKRERA